MKIILRKYRKGLKMSQKELGSKVGVTRIHISNIENDKCTPSPELLMRIANVLNICPKDMISFCDLCEKITKKQCCKKRFF